MLLNMPNVGRQSLKIATRWPAQQIQHFRDGLIFLKLQKELPLAQKWQIIGNFSVSF